MPTGTNYSVIVDDVETGWDNYSPQFTIINKDSNGPLGTTITFVTTTLVESSSSLLVTSMSSERSIVSSPTSAASSVASASSTGISGGAIGGIAGGFIGVILILGVMIYWRTKRPVSLPDEKRNAGRTGVTD